MRKSISISLEDFFSKFSVLKYDKNQIIIHGNDIPSGVFYLKKGFVKMNAILENGREITLNIFKAGNYFPMMWAITDIPDTYFYQSVTKVTLQRAPRDMLLAYIKKDPQILYDLTKRFMTGIQGLLTNIQYQLAGNSYHRVVAALIISVKRFGIKEKNNRITFEFPLTHQEISGVAGITRETASLAMGKLEKKKIISYEKRTLVINNLEALIKESTVLL